MIHRKGKTPNNLNYNDTDLQRRDDIPKKNISIWKGVSYQKMVILFIFIVGPPFEIYVFSASRKTKVEHMKKLVEFSNSILEEKERKKQALHATIALVTEDINDMKEKLVSIIDTTPTKDVHADQMEVEISELRNQLKSQGEIIQKFMSSIEKKESLVKTLNDTPHEQKTKGGELFCAECWISMKRYGKVTCGKRRDYLVENHLIEFDVATESIIKMHSYDCITKKKQ
mmetsp:Transcript_39196/g.47140  ORF Transcript_39196/g.47140 Transcript_39196/m.47140 type:complete len:228 (-) Transcript_39196:3-686(-)